MITNHSPKRLSFVDLVKNHQTAVENQARQWNLVQANHFRPLLCSGRMERIHQCLSIHGQ